jgi:hypothetical protein
MAYIIPQAVASHARGVVYGGYKKDTKDESRTIWKRPSVSSALKQGHWSVRRKTHSPLKGCAQAFLTYKR